MAAFTLQVRAPGSHGLTYTLQVPTSTTDHAANRAPGAVERLEYIPAIGILCAFRGPHHREYPVGQILQMDWLESPMGVEDGGEG